MLGHRSRTDLRGMDRQLTVDVALGCIAQRHLGAIQQDGEPALRAGGIGQQRGDVLEPRPAQFRRDADVVDQLSLVHRQADGCGVQFDPRNRPELSLADGNLQRRKLQDAVGPGRLSSRPFRAAIRTGCRIPSQRGRCRPDPAGTRTPPAVEAVLVAEIKTELGPAGCSDDRTGTGGRAADFRGRSRNGPCQRKAALVPAGDLNAASQIGRSAWCSRRPSRNRLRRSVRPGGGRSIARCGRRRPAAASCPWPSVPGFPARPAGGRTARGWST